MKRTLTRFLLLFLLMSSVCAAQKKMNIDSLWKVYNTTSASDTDRCKAIHAMAWRFVFADPDSAMHLAELEYKFGIQKKAAKYVSSGLSTIGVAWLNKGELDSALHYHSLSYANSLRSGDKRGQAVSLNNMGIVYYEKGDYLTAIDHYERSLVIKRDLKDMTGVAAAYINIGMIYSDQTDLAKAVSFYRRALVIRDSLHDNRGIADANHQIGGYYMSMGKLDSAWFYYKRAEKYFQLTDDVKGYANCLSNMGMVFQKKSQVDSAYAYFDRAFSIRQKAGDRKGIAFSYSLMGELFLLEGKHQDALTNCLHSLEIADDIGFPEIQQRACDCIASTYEEMGQPAKAYPYYKRAMVLKDSLNDADKLRAITSKDLQYEFQKKQLKDSLENVRHNEKLESEHRTEINKQKTYTYAGIAGLVLMILVAFAFFRNARLKQRTNSLLEEQNKVITTQKIEVEQQKQMIEEKQKEVMGSIHYAKKIQNAQLPTEKYIENSLKRLREKN